jgi:hypothetical protein
MNLAEFFADYLKHDDSAFYLNDRLCHSSLCLSFMGSNRHDNWFCECDLQDFLFKHMKKSGLRIKREHPLPGGRRVDFAMLDPSKSITHMIELKISNHEHAIGQLFSYERAVYSGYRGFTTGKRINKILIGTDIPKEVLTTCEDVGIACLNITVYLAGAEGHAHFNKGQQEYGIRSLEHWQTWGDRDDAMMLLRAYKNGKIDIDAIKEA